MSELQDIKQAVKNLSSDILKKFRSWFNDFDAEIWDKEIEQDINSGKLNSLANVAIFEHKAGITNLL